MTYIKNIISLIILVPVSLCAWKMESGTIPLPSTVGGGVGWMTVTLKQTYTEPLVFVMPTEEPGFPASEPVALRIKNVTSESFEVVQLAGTNSTDSNSQHPAMTINYFVIEKGVHDFEGIQIVANDVNVISVQHGNNVPGVEGWTRENLAPGFSVTPTVLTMIQTVNNQPSLGPDVLASPWITSTISNLNNTRFDMALERSEVNRGSVTTPERVAYVAFDRNIQHNFNDTKTCGTVNFETINTPVSINGWDDTPGCYPYSFNLSYTSIPKVIGSQNSHNGGDGGWLRRCSISTNNVGITMDEDIYLDDRTHPASESAGLLVFEKDFVYDSNKVLTCNNEPVVEYRMDECSWSSIIGEVKDSSSNFNNATSYNSATISTTDSLINFAGHFTVDQDQVVVEDSTIGNTNDALSVSFWVKLDEQLGQWAVLITKTTSYNWNNGWGFVNPTVAGNTFRFYINNFSSGARIDTTLTVADGWTHFLGTYNGNILRLYKNGVEVTTGVSDNSGILNSVDPIRMAFDDIRDATLKGKLDEVKVWNVALTSTEVSTIYNNELMGHNYDGTERNDVVCGASIVANSWEMISIPQESRGTTVLGVQDVFGDDFIGANYNAGDTDGWILWKRDYNQNNNLHTYHMVDYDGNEAIDFNKGYWLGSTVSVDWDVDETQPLDYNSTYNGTSDCTSNRCVEIDLVSVQREGLRYNLSNFPGKSAVDWADCRFIISDTNGSNVEILTPKEADTAGYVSRTIAIWPGAGQAGTGTDGQVVNGDYFECHDESVGGCNLLPYHSVWIQLLTPSLDKKIKLLVPEE